MHSPFEPTLQIGDCKGFKTQQALGEIVRANYALQSEPSSDGFQPNSNGLQPNSNGLNPIAASTK